MFLWIMYCYVLFTLKIHKHLFTTLICFLSTVWSVQCKTASLCISKYRCGNGWDMGIALALLQPGHVKLDSRSFRFFLLLRLVHVYTSQEDLFVISWSDAASASREPNGARFSFPLFHSHWPLLTCPELPDCARNNLWDLSQMAHVSIAATLFSFCLLHIITHENLFASHRT